MQICENCVKGLILQYLYFVDVCFSMIFSYTYDVTPQFKSLGSGDLNCGRQAR